MTPIPAVPPTRAGRPPSLHQRILAGIRDRIVSGDWPPGYRIPFEHELTAEYGCSRMTVNKVLTQLATAGLIRRQRRAGSFVTRPQSQSAVLEIREIESEVEALGLPYGFLLLERRRRQGTRSDRERLGVGSAGPVLALHCLHTAGREPFCLEDRLIDLATVPEAAQEPFETVPPGAWLMRRVPWNAAEHRIRAAAADAATAAGLRVPEGTPCLLVERQTWIQDRPVTAVRLAYRGDSHALVARFAPRAG